MATILTDLLHREQRRPNPQVDNRDSSELPLTGMDQINRLICAAIVSETFRDDLLVNPAKALDAGYSGEKFPLSAKERLAILSIDAVTLDEFTVKLMNQLNQQTDASILVYQEYQARYDVPLQVSHGAD